MGTYQQSKLYNGSEGSFQSQVVDAAAMGQDFLHNIQLPT
jgi:hypothetical protein